MKRLEKDRFIISVKVGPKGQITIPKKARERFNIQIGDTLRCRGDKERGIALVKADAVYDRRMGKNGNRHPGE